MPNAKKNNKWKRAFKEKFSELSHKWEMVVVQNGQKQDSVKDDMKTCKFKSKTKFECRKCKHAWTSLFAMVVFQFKLRRNVHGEVKMHLIGQLCKKCSSDVYERPMWSEEQISAAMARLRQRVNEAYYGAEKPRNRSKKKEKNNMRGPHIQDLCEACALGVCTRS
ncbi:Hypothetical predicted protein [Paramuricea clavata]|uniref:Uncharacterized protein n=1 Tax=Paramuricea clavata TaxID=317549 RepID=A0A6S7GGM6_PARCT|nr:Hypothetical predicted protein [Paramuricea clavata]